MPARGVVPRVGVERHAVGGDVGCRGLPWRGAGSRRRAARLPGSGVSGSASRIRRTVDLMPGNAAAAVVDQRAQLGLDLGRDLLRDHAAVEPERDPVGHDVGVDAALDQPDVERRRAMPGRRRTAPCASAARWHRARRGCAFAASSASTPVSGIAACAGLPRHGTSRCRQPLCALTTA